MSECRSCGGRATVFLCHPCEKRLGRDLADLPWWLERLTEAALGQTRMSDNGGRRSAARRDLDGETPLAECIATLPDGEPDLAKAQHARHQAALSKALAAGGINHRASRLLAEIADSLGYWVRVLCESHGVIYIPPVSATHGGDFAAWLAVHVSAISGSEDAGTISDEVQTHIADIVQCVNRPIPVRTLGRCPTWVESAQCGQPLRAPADLDEVKCRACKTIHAVNRLMLQTMTELGDRHFTAAELATACRRLPEEFRVTDRTLRRWRRLGLLRPVGWRRGGPAGRRVPTWHSDADEPEYAWADIEALRTRDRRRVAVESQP